MAKHLIGSTNSAFFSLLFLVLQLLLSPLHRKLGAESITVSTLNMCLAHYKHSRAERSLASLYKLFLPPPERNTDGLLPIPFLPPVSCGIHSLCVRVS